MADYQLYKEQLVKAPLKDVWDFISNPANLKKITPEHMGFEIKSKNLTEKMYAGMIIKYNVKPMFGINTTWITEITQVEDGKYFIDEQRLGPYKLWHHQHFLKESSEGTIMEDIVTYVLPFGIFGLLAHKIFIKKKLKQIFDYRTKAITNIFP